MIHARTRQYIRDGMMEIVGVTAENSVKRKKKGARVHAAVCKCVS